MTFTPLMYQLHGTSYEKAECYGKPHIGCSYTSDSVSSCARRWGQPCIICGRPATNAHHVPPRGTNRGGTFELVTEHGRFSLKPALFALCGSGTTGCHNDFHGGGRFFPRWVWNSDVYAEAWWSGALLKQFEPHSPALYGFGRWEVEDRDTGEIFVYDGGEPWSFGR